MDERDAFPPRARPGQAWPTVRWSAVATGGLLGAAAMLVLLRFGAVRGVIVEGGLLLRGGLPDTAHRLWWMLVSLLSAALAGWAGAAASGERDSRGASLHGLLAWSAALVLGAVAGLGSADVLPAGAWSSVAGLVGALAGASVGRAQVARRARAAWSAGAGRPRRAEAPVQPRVGAGPAVPRAAGLREERARGGGGRGEGVRGEGVRGEPQAAWRDVLGARRGERGERASGRPRTRREGLH